MFKHLHYFKSWLLLCLLVVGGVSSAWAEDSYEKATSISVGDVVVFVTEDASNELTSFSSTSTVYGIGTAYTTAPAGTFSFEVVAGSSEGTFAFKNGNNYLYWTSGNSLNVNSTSSDNTSWNVSIDNDGNATITNAKEAARQIWWNVSSPRFACYTGKTAGTGYYSVQLYKKVTGGADTPSLETCDLALTGAPIALTFDLYNNSGAQVVNYTTTSTGAVTVADSEYATFSVDQENKTITVTPTAVTPSTQTITVSQAADETYAAGSATFTLTITDSTPVPTHTVTFSINGATTTTEFAEGAAITFPEVPAIDDKVFVGWTENAITGVSDEAPAYTTVTTMGESDLTFYAVFAEQSGDVTPKSIEIDANTSGVPSSYGTATEYTIGDFKFKIQQMYKNGEKLQWRASGNTNGTGTIYNVDKLNSIQSIVLNYNSTDTGKNFTLKVGDAENPTSGTEITPTTNDAVYTFDCSANNYDYFVLANGTGAGYLDKLTINFLESSVAYSNFCTTVAADTRIDPELSFAESEVTLEWTARANYSVQALSTTATNVPSPIVWTSSNEEVATFNADNNSLTIVGLGTTTIKAAFAGDENFKKSEASYTLTIQDSRQALTLSFDPATLTLNVGETAALPALSGNVGQGAVTYQSDNSEIAYVGNDNSGAQLVFAGQTEGTATITATVAETNDYLGGTATFTVTVSDPNRPGSATNPYTVEEALAASAATGVYVKGFISAITEVSTQYYNATYTITDGENTMIVYRGKYLDNANFTATDQIQVGDYVEVYGNLTVYNNVNQLAQGNYIVKLTRKEVATLSFEEDSYEVGLSGTVTVSATSNSTGAITYSSSDNTIAEVNETSGVVTPHAEGEVTITATVEDDNTYKGTTAEVTLTVVDDRTPVATDISLDVTSVTVNAEGTFVATATENEGVTGNVTYTYSSSDDLIVVDDDGSYLAGSNVGTATIIVTATPDQADQNRFKAVSTRIEVVVTDATVLALSESEDVLSYGTPYALTFEVPENYDGTVTAVVSPANVATATIEGTTITITPQAISDVIATLTVTASEGERFYKGTDTEEFTFMVDGSSLTGKETAPIAEPTVVFYESFDSSTGTAGWSGSTANGTLTCDNKGWTTERGNGNGGSAKFGTGSAQGYAISPALGQAGDFTLTFKAGAWSGDKTTGALVVFAIDGENTISSKTFDLADSEWADFEMAITGATATTQLKFSAAQSSKNRFLLDEVKVIKPAEAIAAPTLTLSATGYASYCCEYPLDFSENDKSVYRAWYVSNVSGETVTFEEIKGAIKGGTPFILYGTPNAECTLKYTSSENGIEGNKLHGTLAPTYLESTNSVINYGLSSGSFKKLSNGVVPANKAYLPIETAVVPEQGVRQLRFVFVDDTTSGVAEVKTVNFGSEQVYNLNGQRVLNPKKGQLYIVNGKKVVIK